MRLLSTFASLLLIAACATSGRKAPVYSYEDFEKIWSVRGGFIRVPQQNFFYALLKGPTDQYTRLYKFDTASKTLTLEYDAGGPIGFFFADPQHKTFYLTKDNGGDENFQIYQYFPRDKKIQKIFGHTGFAAFPGETSEDGHRLYISSNHEDKATHSLYLYDNKTLAVTRLTRGVSMSDVVIDHDETTALLSKNVSNSEEELYVLNLKTRALKRLRLPTNSYGVSAFHPKDKNTVLINTDYNFDRQYCALLNLKTLKIEKLFQDASKDISCSYSFTENLSMVNESADAKNKMKLFEGFFEKEVALPPEVKDMTLGSQSLYPFEGRKWSFVARSSNNPGTLYEYSLQTKELTELFPLNAGPIQPQDFAKSFDFHYKSFDQKPIHAVYFAKEAWLKEKTKRPVILWPHGGPDWLIEHDYNVMFQYWVNRGYIVLAPNFRGSTGYGKAFEKLNDHDWGGGHIKDLIWAKKAFADLPYADAEHFFIVGRSFGGYSVLSAITQYPTEFKAAEASAAMGNLFTFMKSIPPDPAWQGEFRSEVGDPVKNKKLYQERSPFFYAQNIKIPLKINQAENDVRTVLAEMDAFVAKLRQLKIPVDYTVFKNEGHNFQNKDTVRKSIVDTVDFLDRYR